jgi:hypothetical protein
MQAFALPQLRLPRHSAVSPQRFRQVEARNLMLVAARAGYACVRQVGVRVDAKHLALVTTNRTFDVALGVLRWRRIFARYGHVSRRTPIFVATECGIVRFST